MGVGALLLSEKINENQKIPGSTSASKKYSSCVKRKLKPVLLKLGSISSLKLTGEINNTVSKTAHFAVSS